MPVPKFRNLRMSGAWAGPFCGMFLRNCIFGPPLIVLLQPTTKCDKFFTAMPQTDALGVNFFLFAQKYFWCPPVKSVVLCFQKLAETINVSSLLLVPEWTGAVFWPYIFTGKSWQKPVVKFLYCQAGFFFSNKAESKVFTGKPNFPMVALVLQT